MLENFINIIGWLIVCLLSLGVLWVLVWSALMVIGYRMYKQSVKESEERRKRREERSDKMFKKATK